MAYEVVATAEFDAQLDEAVTFRIDNYGMRSARRLLDGIDHVAGLLSGTPGMGSILERDDAAGVDEGLRWTKADSYIVVYRVHRRARQVALLKLFAASSNWRRRVR